MKTETREKKDRRVIPVANDSRLPNLRAPGFQSELTIDEMYGRFGKGMLTPDDIESKERVHVKTVADKLGRSEGNDDDRAGAALEETALIKDHDLILLTSPMEGQGSQAVLGVYLGDQDGGKRVAVVFTGNSGKWENTAEDAVLHKVGRPESIFADTMAHYRNAYRVTLK